MREYNLASVKAAFSSRRFWQYSFMMFGANIFGSVFSYEYKPYGLANGLSDEFLTWAGSFSSLVQIVTRLSIGIVYDLVGFKGPFLFLMVINLINSLICYQAVHSQFWYFICIQLNYVVLGGIFALFPAPASKTFGNKIGVRIYAIILMAAVAANGFDTILVH